MSAIEARFVSYEVGGRRILDGVNLSVERGKSMAITGPSGTGKTTLLMCLAGILLPTNGDVSIDGKDLNGLSAAARAALRLRHIGIIYQFGELLPELTPIENVTLPAILRGTRQRPAREKALALMDDLKVAALASGSTATLSGGERQRVAVARALVTGPAVVLADEPTGSLDRNGADAVADLLFGLPGAYGCALVVVTHNDDVAGRADQVYSLGSQTVSAA